MRQLAIAAAGGNTENLFGWSAPPPDSAPRYPEAPGFKAKGGTSEESAIKVAGYSKKMRALVLAKLAEAGATGMTADEVGIALNLSPFSARPRISELFRLGKVEPTGERRRNESGHAANVWRVVPDLPQDGGAP